MAWDTASCMKLLIAMIGGLSPSHVPFPSLLPEEDSLWYGEALVPLCLHLCVYVFSCISNCRNCWGILADMWLRPLCNTKQKKCVILVSHGAWKNEIKWPLPKAICRVIGPTDCIGQTDRGCRKDPGGWGQNRQCWDISFCGFCLKKK